MQQNEFKFSSVQLISFIVKWWVHILIITLIGTAGSIAASFLIKDRFRSTVVFYPVTTNSISNTLLNFGSNRKDFLEFGDEDEAETALQILESETIRNFIIANFDLYTHYKINPDKQFARTRMNKRYKQNVKFRRTEYNSVEIAVLDEDPQMAADIANSIAEQLDTVKNRIQKERAIQGMNIVKEKYEESHALVQFYSDSLTKLRRLGVNDISSQSEMFYEQYALALAKNNTSAIKILEDKISLISEYGSQFVEVSSKLVLYSEQETLMKLKLEEAKVDAEKFVPQKMVVNYATPADRKTYPKRLYIVVGATFATFCMAVFFLIGLENWKKYKASLQQNTPENQA